MDILISTGCGNIIGGGADVWTNHFLELVYPIISKDTAYVLLIDGRKPVGWDVRSVHGVPVHFYYDDVELSLNLLKSSRKIHFLHSHYYEREHLMEFKDKFGIIFIHAYPQDILRGENNFFKSPISIPQFDKFLSYGQQLVWIGIDKRSSVYDRFKPINIPNFYEFKHNIPYTKRVNPTVGYAARIESRKNPQYLTGKKGFVLTNQADWKIFKNLNHIDDKNLRIYQWNAESLDPFMRKTWSVSHSCHDNEPFGYSIFQAVDYGKLPIINTWWAPDVPYKFRANTLLGFSMCLYRISEDSDEELQEEFRTLKNFMKKFDNKEKWVERIVNLFNC